MAGLPADMRPVRLGDMRGYDGSSLNKWMNPHKNSIGEPGCAGCETK